MRTWINPPTTANLRGDLVGGVVAGVVALPLAVAFGVASGAGAVAGLYGAAIVGIFAALFGGTPAQISGPTGPMTIVVASVFAQFAQQPAVAFTVVMLGGAFQILFGVLKLGRYINLMPYPVISGFMSGIGCILIIIQLGPLLGYPAGPSIASSLSALEHEFTHINFEALVLGLVSFAICQFLPRPVKRLVPAPLLALLLGTLAASLWFPGAPTLGTIPTGWPTPHPPTFEWSLIQPMLIGALVLAGLGSIDSLLTSLVADNMTRQFHDSDRELTGQGIGNLVAGLFGGIPGAGATIRTVTNIQAGGRTPLSGVVHGLTLLLVIIALAPLAAHIPHAVLAGILFKVGIDVIDKAYLKRVHRMPVADGLFMLIVLVLTVFVDVITAVAVGMVLSSLLFVKEMADLQHESIRTVLDPSEGSILSAPERDALAACGGTVLILHLAGPISFGAANSLTRRMAGVTDFKTLIVDLTDVPHFDGSAALAVENIVRRALHAGQEVKVVGLSRRVSVLLNNLGTLDLIRETHRYHSRLDAIRAAAAELKLEPPRPSRQI